MSPGGLVALALVAITLVGIGSLLVPPRRRPEPDLEAGPAAAVTPEVAAAPTVAVVPAAAAPADRPMTVADLVRMREAARSSAVVAPAADPAPDPAPEPVAAEEAPEPAGDPAEADAPDEPPGRPVATVPVDVTDDGRAGAVEPDHAYGGDTPWARGARLVAGGAAMVHLPPPAEVPPVQAATEEPAAAEEPAAEEPPSEPDAPEDTGPPWSSWPDWADVDALEDGARPAPAPTRDAPAFGGSTVPVPPPGENGTAGPRAAAAPPEPPPPLPPSGTSPTSRPGPTGSVAEPGPRGAVGPLLLAPGRPAEAEVDAPQPVRFHVVTRDGVPVAAAAVTLLDGHGDEAGTAVACADGRGAIEAPRGGGYVIVSSAPEHQPGAVAVTVRDEPVQVEVLVVPSAAVSGTVRDAAGPVEGARVVLVQGGDLVELTTTDAAGAFRFTDLSAGRYAVSASAAGRCSGPGPLLVPEGDETRLDLELTEDA